MNKELFTGYHIKTQNPIFCVIWQKIADAFLKVCKVDFLGVLNVLYSLLSILLLKNYNK